MAKNQKSEVLCPFKIYKCQCIQSMVYLICVVTEKDKCYMKKSGHVENFNQQGVKTKFIVTSC